MVETVREAPVRVDGPPGTGLRAPRQGRTGRARGRRCAPGERRTGEEWGEVTGGQGWEVLGQGGLP